VNCDRARYNLVNETTFVHRAAAWAHSVCCRRCRSEVAQRKGIERQLARVPAVAPPESLVRAWGAILPERSPRRRRRVLLAAALAPIVLLTAAALWVAAQRIEWLDPTARRLSRLQPAECSLRLRAGPGVAVAIDPMIASDLGGLFYSWWPDGNTIAYASRPNPQAALRNLLWKLDPKTGDRELLVEESRPYIFSPQVVPTGDRISYGDGKYLKLYDTATGNVEVVPESFGGGIDATWCPDGRYVAFNRVAWNDEGGRREYDKRGLWIWDTRDRQLRRVVRYSPECHTTDDGMIYDPRWSPDGQWIVFLWRVSYRSESSLDVEKKRLDLYCVRPDGSDLHRMASVWTGGDRIELGQQCWSPDSSKIVFAWRGTLENPGWRWLSLWTERGVTALDVETGEITTIVAPGQLGSRSYFLEAANWSPTGEHVAFAVQREGGWRSDICVASTQTGAAASVASAGEEWSNARPIWAPDGRSLMYKRYYRKREGAKLAHWSVSELWLVELNLEE